MKHVYQGNGIDGIKYHWSQASVFTRQSKDKQLVLFIDCPKAVVDQIVRNCLSGSSRSVGLTEHVASSCRDPFIWHALLIGGLEAEYEKDYWRLRDIVRKWERVCNTSEILLFAFVEEHCGYFGIYEVCA
jgi:hypothetical protein